MVITMFMADFRCIIMDWIASVRGIKFRNFQVSSPENHLTGILPPKTISNIYDDDSGDMPWFDFSVFPFNDNVVKSEPSVPLRSFINASTQTTVVMTDVAIQCDIKDPVEPLPAPKTIVNQEELNSLATIARLVEAHKGGLKVPVRRSLFREQNYLKMGQSYVFSPDHIHSSIDGNYDFPCKVIDKWHGSISFVYK
jgi:hypothetical protein